MQFIIEWVKNNTQNIYLWIGRLTVFVALATIAFIIVRGIMRIPGFTFDPVLYVLIVGVLYVLQRQNTLIKEVIGGANTSYMAEEIKSLPESVSSVIKPKKKLLGLENVYEIKLNKVYLIFELT